jgi:CBS domain-containing protein
MRADQIMTQNVITIRPEGTIADAAKMMLQHHISGLPVVDEAGELRGIISESDFLRRVEIGTQKRRGRWLRILVGPGKAASEYVHEQGRKVREIMTTTLCTVTRDASLGDIVELMEKNNIKRVPVVAEDRLVGIVTRSNLMQAVSAIADNVPGPTGNDDQIRDKTLKSFEENDWATVGLGVIVKDGVVHLSGMITDERSRQASIVAAENVPGVKRVHDHLCWVGPIAGMYLNSSEDA